MVSSITLVGGHGTAGAWDRCWKANMAERRATTLGIALRYLWFGRATPCWPAPRSTATSWPKPAPMPSNWPPPPPPYRKAAARAHEFQFPRMRRAVRPMPPLKPWLACCRLPGLCRVRDPPDQGTAHSAAHFCLGLGLALSVNVLDYVFNVQVLTAPLTCLAT